MPLSVGRIRRVNHRYQLPVVARNARTARKILGSTPVDNYLHVEELNHNPVIRKVEIMYELSDWGRPMAPPEFTNREKLAVQLPHSLVRVLRSRARAQGVSLNVLIDQVLHEALALPRRHGAEQASVVSAFD